MVSNQQHLNQVSINEFFRALGSLGVKKNDISNDPLKINYSSVAPYCTHQRNSTPTKYEDETKMIMRKKYGRQVISIELIKTRKHHRQACHSDGKAMFTSHQGASRIFYMFINLLIKLTYYYI